MASAPHPPPAAQHLPVAPLSTASSNRPCQPPNPEKEVFPAPPAGRVPTGPARACPAPVPVPSCDLKGGPVSHITHCPPTVELMCHITSEAHYRQELCAPSPNRSANA
jgi:hypothetical protein